MRNRTKMNFLLIFFAFSAALARGSDEFMREKRLAKVNPQGANSICATYSDWTLIPHEKNCHRFYACLNHEAEEFQCAENFYFNKIELRCLPGLCNADFATELQTCPAHLQVVERVPGDCSAFTWCLNGVQEVLRCPAGQYFDVTFASCQLTQPSVYHQCSCLLPEHTVLANAANCQTYYVCAGGKALLEHCPRGHYYNERIRSCLPDVEHVCVPALNELEAAMLDVCERLGTKGAILQPHPKNCGKFFLCLNGRIFTKDCPKGFYFDRYWRYCRQDQQDKCAKQMSITEAEKRPASVEKQLATKKGTQAEKANEKPDEDQTASELMEENEVVEGEESQEDIMSDRQSEEVEWGEELITAEGQSVADMKSVEKDEEQFEKLELKTEAEAEEMEKKKQLKISSNEEAEADILKPLEIVEMKEQSEEQVENNSEEVFPLQQSEKEHKAKEEQQAREEADEEEQTGKKQQHDMDEMKIEAIGNKPEHKFPITQSPTPQKKPALSFYDKLASKFMYS